MKRTLNEYLYFISQVCLGVVSFGIINSYYNIRKIENDYEERNITLHNKIKTSTYSV